MDEAGQPLPARVSVTDSRRRSYAPDEAWMHADDMLVPERQAIETRYFHSTGRSRISVPLDRLAITVSHGPAYEVAHLDEDPRVAGWRGDANGDAQASRRRRLAFGRMVERRPARAHELRRPVSQHAAHLAEQARAEDLNLIYNLIVNKEQRVPGHRELSSGSGSRIDGDAC